MMNRILGWCINCQIIELRFCKVQLSKTQMELRAFVMLYLFGLKVLTTASAGSTTQWGTR